ncbi:flagellar export protein FliJ [Halorhodospira neutriphila]|uniref:Flagellar FliJ protein n=1 Tax=Halorhodospira neutriphila TaxID=168379 RepID=A0ABS1E6N7_9GAMM|nr:flagellar export protein FliJ [Halorhodospira neutriphila]MBK1726889.1 flagellar export protein FliJ [Halorhodospira neutriphila]
MSQDSSRLYPVQRLTSQRRDQAAAELRQAEGELRRHEQRLEEILELRQQYCRQLSEDGAIEASRLRDFNVFLTRLDEAVVQQRQSVAQQQRRVTQLHRQWLQRWGEHRTIEHVVERRAEAERAEQARREQREADETARLLYQALQRGHLPGKG